MKRYLQGLHQADGSAAEPVVDGLLLIKVERAQHRWDSRKPYYLLRFAILEPQQLAGRSFASRLYCSPKALWMLNWFLRDFGYNPDLLASDEIDTAELIGLRGVVKISHTVIDGTRRLNLDGFAPAGRWGELSESPSDQGHSGVVR